MKLELEPQLKTSLFDYIDRECLFRANPETQYYPYMPRGRLIPNNTTNNGLTWCFYLRNLTHNAKYLLPISYLIAQDIIKKIFNQREHANIQLCGMETSSIPLMTGIQLAFLQAGISVNAFTVRKNRKGYALCHLIDGKPTSDYVIYIDDTINTGTSFARTMDACYHELDLRPANHAYSIISGVPALQFKGQIVDVNYFFHKDEFNKEFDESKYWLPKDCDRSKPSRVD